MKVIFMGTPEYARVCLEGLIDGGYEVLAVVTQPDRPAGRGKKPQMSPVKVYAIEHGIEVLQPERINRGDFPAQLESYGADVFVVAAFGQILSQRVLDIPKYGCINVHASLLPKYRGASPIQQAILEGETHSGITIMQMDRGVDTGDILHKSEVAITPDDTGGTLHDKLCDIAPKALIDTLVQIAQGEVVPTPQDHAQATHAPMITKEMARINFNHPATQVIDTIRAYNPFPGAFAEIDGKVLKVWRAVKADGEPKFCPKDGIFVAAEDGIIQLLEITPPNGKKMSSADYVRGLK